jgi:hypothetical protein
VLSQGQLEVIYNGDALEQSLAQSKIQAAVAQANLELSQQIRQLASRGIDLLLQGGDLSQLGINQPRLLGLEAAPKLLSGVIARQPPGRARQELERVRELASFAADNLNISKDVLATVGQPVRVNATTVHGRRTPLDTFAVVVAVSISLMFVCVLLAAGGIALEREDNTLARLTRRAPGRTGRGAPGGAGSGLVTREGLIVEKLLLAGGCAFVLAFLMLAGIGAFVALDWSRIALWLAALAFAALAFAALGVAIGALAREVRAASLLAFLLSLPLAFLTLVPAGAVAPAIYDVIRAVSAVFPFKAALQALDAAVNGAEPAIGGSLLHLLALTLLFGVLARVGLRRA